jgi:hypothetical protein
MNANSGRGVPSLKEFGDFGRDRARHDARAEFDHVHLKALGPRRGGEFQADKSGPDDHDMSRRGHAMPQCLALVERSQIKHVRQIGIGNV